MLYSLLACLLIFNIFKIEYLYFLCAALLMDSTSGKDGWLVGGGSVLNLFVFGTLINVLLCVVAGLSEHYEFLLFFSFKINRFHSSFPKELGSHVFFYILDLKCRFESPSRRCSCRLSKKSADWNYILLGSPLVPVSVDFHILIVMRKPLRTFILMFPTSF